MSWAEHKKRWINCQECALCEQRRKVVLLRGKIPCDVLFIGEAPGTSENALGKPFIGPAGKLLDRMVNRSEKVSGVNLRLAFTHLVGCVPLDDQSQKLRETPKEAIIACSLRLQELITLCQPRQVVCVGKLPSKWVPRLVTLEKDPVTIISPSVILRADQSQQGLAVQKTEIQLTDLFEELFNAET